MHFPVQRCLREAVDVYWLRPSTACIFYVLVKVTYPGKVYHRYSKTAAARAGCRRSACRRPRSCRPRVFGPDSQGLSPEPCSAAARAGCRRSARRRLRSCICAASAPSPRSGPRRPRSWTSSCACPSRQGAVEPRSNGTRRRPSRPRAGDAWPQTLGPALGTASNQVMFGACASPPCGAARCSSRACNTTARTGGLHVQPCFSSPRSQCRSSALRGRSLHRPVLSALPPWTACCAGRRRSGVVRWLAK